MEKRNYKAKIQDFSSTL